MNIDLVILKLLFIKETFNKYNKIVNLDFYKNNNKEMFKIFLTLFKLHERIDHDVSTNDLAVFYYTQYPNAAEKAENKLFLDKTISQLDSLEVDTALAEEYLQKHHDKALATEIAIKSLEISQGAGDLSLIQELLNTSNLKVNEATTDYFVSDDIETLINQTYASEGLRWRCNTLNKSLGSLRKGNFGFLYARPETGKTTFLTSECGYMAQQAKEKDLGVVLHLNNEEQGSVVKLRYIQAVLGVSSNDLIMNFHEYQSAYDELAGSHIKVYDNAGMTRKDVESLCKDLKPSLIICDQLDKIRWPDSERHDLKMKAIYQWARELAKEYAPFLAVCQAGGTGDGKKYLTMNDVDSSHTAKQGEADFMIGIGKTYNDAEEYIRYISIAKNKLTGDVDTNPEMRHAKVPLRIVPNIARYEDMLDL